MFKIYPHEIVRLFDSKLKYISTPISLKDAENFVKLIDLDCYENVLSEYGEIHCLILLDFFEKKEEYSTCKEILRQIQEYNKNHGTNYCTSINKIKTVF